jgi:hypothetical protein
MSLEKLKGGDHGFSMHSGFLGGCRETGSVNHLTDLTDLTHLTDLTDVTALPSKGRALVL